MTLKEAKKILKEEGYFLVKVSKGFEFSELPVWEKPEVVEAKRVVNKNGFATAMNTNEWIDRQERLKKEYEKNTKAPCSGEEQPKEKKGIICPTTFPKADFYHKHVLNEGNPALKEAASQFNDALLDEQAKKIERLKKETAELLGIVERMKQDVKEVDYKFNAACKENERLNEKIRELINEKTNLEDQITILNACKKHNDKIDRKQIKRLGKEISKLNGIIHKKNLKIEELGKESFRHLSGKVKMFGENVDLEQMLKDKNAVLADVAEELRLTKIREKNLAELGLKYVVENEKLKKELEEKTKLVEIVRNASKEYCDYGVAANEFIKKLANLYVIAFNDGTFSNKMFERCKNYQTYGFPVKDTHPTEDNPEEVKMNEILEHVRKFLEEGGTVTTSYDKAEEGGDQSATIVQHRKSIVDLFKEIKRLWQE